MTETATVQRLSTDTLTPDDRLDHILETPDEWGRQSFPASDPPQNW